MFIQACWLVRRDPYSGSCLVSREKGRNYSQDFPSTREKQTTRFVVWLLTGVTQVAYELTAGWQIGKNTVGKNSIQLEKSRTTVNRYSLSLPFVYKFLVYARQCRISSINSTIDSPRKHRQLFKNNPTYSPANKNLYISHIIIFI